MHSTSTYESFLDELKTLCEKYSYEAGELEQYRYGDYFYVKIVGAIVETKQPKK